MFFGRSREKYIEEKSIISISTSYKHNQDVLELKEEELMASLLQNQLSDISANMHEVMRHSSRRLDCEQPLFCSKIRRETRKEELQKKHLRASVICEAASRT